MIKNNSKRTLIFGSFFAITSTLLWAGNLTISRGINAHISPVTLSLVRWSIASIALLPFGIKPLFKQWENIKKNILYLFATAFLGIAFFNTLVYTAAKTTTAINLSIISITFPIFILMFSAIFYHEKINAQRTVGLVLVIVGTIYLTTKGNFQAIFVNKPVIGDLIMLIASIVFATYSIFLKNKPKELELIPLQLITFIIGTILLLPIYFLQNDDNLVIPLSLNMLGIYAYLGIFASVIAFISWNFAISLLGATKAGIIYYIIPIFSSILAFSFLNEKIAFYHFVCFGLILLGILLARKD